MQQTAAAGHREECSGQATKSACHLVKSLAGALAFTRQRRTHTCSLCAAVKCHKSIVWLYAALLTTERDSVPHEMLHGCLFCLLARGLDSIVKHNMSVAIFAQKNIVNLEFTMLGTVIQVTSVSKCSRNQIELAAKILCSSYRHSL